jgi:cell filamentation protein
MDPDHIYTDPNSGVLRNLAGINDPNALKFAETAVTTKRAIELNAHPIPIHDVSVLFAIHRHLFQDIYDWAGERRSVEISKGDKPFFPLSHFNNALYYIDVLIAGYKLIKKATNLL